jgi:hypothetical protein
VYCICLIALFLLGIVSFYFSIRITSKDRMFKQWQHKSNYLYVCLVNKIQILSIANYKLQNLIWCGIKVLPFLENITQLRYLSLISAFGISITLSHTVVTIILISLESQLQLIYYDCLTVMVLSSIFSLLSIRRHKDLFIYV